MTTVTLRVEFQRQWEKKYTRTTVPVEELLTLNEEISTDLYKMQKETPLRKSTYNIYVCMSDELII